MSFVLNSPKLAIDVMGFWAALEESATLLDEQGHERAGRHFSRK